MKLRHAAMASLAFTAACAPMQKKEAAGPAQAAQDTVRVSNQHSFDTAVCQSAQPLQLPQPVNPDILLQTLEELLAAVVFERDRVERQGGARQRRSRDTGRQ